METVVSDNYTEIVDGPIYQWESDETLDRIAPHIPSPRDVTAEFIAALSRLVGGVDAAQSRGGRHVLARFRGAELRCERRKLYLKTQIDYDTIVGPRLADGVRSAFFDVARVLATRVATKISEERMRLRHEGRMSVHFLGECPLIWKEPVRGVPRIATTLERDSMTIVFASYFHLVPVE